MSSLYSQIKLLFLKSKFYFTIFLYYIIGNPLRKYKNSFVRTSYTLWIRTSVALKHASVISSEPIETVHDLLQNLKVTFPSATEELNNYAKKFGARSYWFVEKPNRKKTDPVLLYYHGGGYVSQLNILQLFSILAIYGLVDKDIKDNLSILILDYSLVSQGSTLPTQLNQAYEDYSEIIKSSSNIIVMGDSAGGHLATVLLQKLKVEKADESHFPRSLILISPWVKLFPDRNQLNEPGNSFYENSKRDIIVSSFFTSVNVEHYVGNSDAKSLLISPNNKTPLLRSDWDGIPTLRDEKSSVFVICGEDESFKDDILDFNKYALGVPLADNKYGDSENVFNPEKSLYISKAGAKGPYVEAYVEPWGVHDASLIHESDLYSKVVANGWKLEDVDSTEFFGLVRITEFINKVLE